MKLIIDSFAGGGGASTGIEMALGRSPDYAINHSADALAMHAVNHPQTEHLDSNIWDVSPREVTKGRPVGLFWASPDCKHFSKAKGGKPMDRNIRDLAWVVVRWAEEVSPDVIILENVEEFVTWGPLYEDGKPIIELRGHTFEEWTKRLKKAGYKVQWKELRACDYGAPTIRKRFFMIARRDGKPIVWPQRTHGDPKKPADAKLIAQGKLLPYRTAAEIIDWTLPCPSIFDSAEEIMKLYGLRAVRPLADATMTRIARGVVRYVLEAKRPFIVRTDMASAAARNGVHTLDDPLNTITTAGSFSLVSPVVTAAQHGGSNRPADAPLHTITASPKDQNAVIAPVLVETAHGEVSPKGVKRWGLGIKHADEPVGTGTISGNHALAAVTMVQTGYGERAGQAPRALDIEKPIGTQVGGAAKHAVVAAFLAQHNTGVVGHDVRKPVSTITQGGSRGVSQQAVIAAHLQNMRGSDRRAAPADEPLRTLSAQGNHAALITPFLQSYYGTGDGQLVDGPMRTDTTKDRFGLVTVEVDGETYAIADIGMRMLTPRERFRAQGFPDTYEIDRRPDGSKLSLTVQGSCCGNSVCPPLAEAIVSANCAELSVLTDSEGAVA